MLVENEGGSKYSTLNILTRPRSTFHTTVQKGLEKLKATFLPKLLINHKFLITACVYAKELMLVETRVGVKILWP